jgi:2-phosphoglycerate kinase
MIYLIGGPARVGKTKLVSELVRARPMHAVSTDAIRYMLRRTVPKDALDPDLFIYSGVDVLNPDKTIEERMELQNRESQALWPALNEFIQSYVEDGIDLVLEGVAITPAFVEQLQMINRSVFLVNRSPEHERVIAGQARANEHDWLHDVESAEIATCAEVYRATSDWLVAECEAKGTSYIEVADDNFEMSLSRAAALLTH